MKFCLLLLLSSLFSTLGYSDLMLEYNVNSILEMPGRENEEKSYEMQLLLGSTFIESKHTEENIIYDFQHKKIYDYNETQEGYYERSLFSDVAFRVFEFRNRFFIKEAMGKFGIEDEEVFAKTSKSTIFIEHNFSLRSEEETELERSENDGRIYFRHDELDLLSYSSELSEISADEVSKFILFLRYQFGIHPNILDELKSLSGIPKSITVGQYDHGVLTTNLNLDSLQELESAMMSDINSIISPDEKLYEVIALAEAATAEDYQNACNAMVELAVMKADEEKYLESFALFMGFSLATSVGLPPEYFNYDEKMKADENVKAVFRSLAVNSKEDAESAEKSLSKMTDKIEVGQYTLKIFNANITKNLGNPTLAENLFMQALEQQPYIVGAWKDLGDIYFQQYQMDKAWHCWDTARKLNSEHKFVSTVDGLEKQLRERNPDYFMTKYGR